MNDTVCDKNFGKLNLVLVWFRLKPIFTPDTAASEILIALKSGSKCLENNHLTSFTKDKSNP